MSAKNIYFGSDARSKMLSGVNKLADAVKVLPVPTVVALVVSVVDVVLESRNGPLVKSTSSNVHDVWPVLDNLLTSCEGWVM